MGGKTEMQVYGAWWEEGASTVISDQPEDLRLMGEGFLGLSGLDHLSYASITGTNPFARSGVYNSLWLTWYTWPLEGIQEEVCLTT